MRFALLFAVRLLISTIVLAYVLAMLADSCLPVADAAGQVQAIPRWEYWLLHASMPSAIWWQWTGGLQPIEMLDRLPILGLASLWILACYWIGVSISRLDSLADRLSKYERFGLSILIGQSVLAMFVFFHASLIGTASLPWMLLIVFVCAALYQTLGHRSTPQLPLPESKCNPTQVVESDASFASSISRRMVGLLFLSTAYLAAVQVYGATIPTQDMHVRDVDWWMTKHAALNGQIRWASNHSMANAPAGFNMPSVFFCSLLPNAKPNANRSPQLRLEATATSFSIEERERWGESLKTCVLAGKTVNAILCLVGIFLAAVHLGKRWGVLSGLVVAMVLLSTPGIAELARLGRTDALVGIWGIGMLVLFQSTREAGQSIPSAGVLWACILAGALGSGYGSALILGAPAIALTLVSYFVRSRNQVAQAVRTSKPIRIFVVVLIVASIAPYLRNAIGSGDPISPWGNVLLQQIGMAERTERIDALLHANRIPSETIDEMIASTDFENVAGSSNENKSPYRLANVLDGVLRLLGNSNAHGLMLIPIAIVGCFVGRMESKRLAICWAAFWMFAWWLISTRQDRDWVGALLLLAWPVSVGANWLAKLARGYFLFLLVVISIAWAVVVIPIWPTSDNRILVALNRIDRGVLSIKQLNSDDNEPISESYSSQFNQAIRKSTHPNSPSKVLLIGESDDFDLLADSVSNGPFDDSLLDQCSDLPAQKMGAVLREYGITEVLVVWSGVRYRERLTGRERESKYRSSITKLLNDSQLQSIPWGINSSEAELFLVKKE